MESIIEALIAAGYFRARVSSLSDFDKLIGGLAWALQVFSYDINIDVFYADSLDLGQKIALTERLVMVLLALKCPYRIEPHQIVGLDWANLVPVVKWLVKRSEEVRREQEAFNRLLALRHYHRATNSTPERSLWCHVVPARHLRQLQVAADQRATADDNEEATAQRVDAAAADQTTTADLITRLDEHFKDNQRVSFVQLAALMRAGNQEAAGRSATAAGEQAHAEESDEAEDDLCAAPRDRCESLARNLATESNAIGVNQTHSRGQQMNDDNDNDNDDDDDEQREAQGRLHRELDDELLATNQKILNLLKRVDSMPSQLEICQYQQRYVELQQQLIGKNKDLKKLFDLYNTLDVTKHYIVKEITLLDSIWSNLELATNSPANRELFLGQLSGIIAKIEQIREDSRARLARLHHKCELLNGELAVLLDGIE